MGPGISKQASKQARSVILIVLAVALAPDQLRAGVFPATRIVQVGDVLVGADGDPVLELSGPATNGLSELGFTGTLDDSPTTDDAFVWFDGEVVWRADFYGAASDATLGFSDAGGWFLAPFGDELWTHNSLLQEVGDTVIWGSETLTVHLMQRPALMTATGVPYWAVKLKTSLNQIRPVILKSPTATAGDIQFEVAPDAEFEGYPLVPWDGANGFDVSPDESQKAYIVHLAIDGGSSPALVRNDEIVVLKGEMTGEIPNEWWKSVGGPMINSAGKLVFYAGTDVPGPEDGTAHMGYAGPGQEPEVTLRTGDCISIPGSSCELLVDSSTFLEWGGMSEGGCIAYKHTEPLGTADENLFFACRADHPEGAHLLLSRFDSVDLDGDGTGDAVVDRVGLPGDEQVAFGTGVLYVGAELIEDGQTREAILEIDLPNCPVSPGWPGC